MQKLKRLDDLIERDAERIEQEHQGDPPSDFQMQIDATKDEIRRAFQSHGGFDERLKAKLTHHA